MRAAAFGSVGARSAIRTPWLSCAVVTRSPAERSMASQAAAFGAHQLAGSRASRCSVNAIWGHSGGAIRLCASIGQFSGTSTSPAPGDVSV